MYQIEVKNARKKLKNIKTFQNLAVELNYDIIMKYVKHHNKNYVKLLFVI